MQVKKILVDDHYRKFSEILVNYKQVCSLVIAIVIFFLMCKVTAKMGKLFLVVYCTFLPVFQRRELGPLIEGLKKLFTRNEEQYPLFLGKLS